MSEAGTKMRRVAALNGFGGGYAHWCPACEEAHVYATDNPQRNGAKWTFDGNLDRPTFTPSMLIRIGPRPTVPEGRPDAGQVDVCHYFLTAGSIQYLADCTHALKGQTIPLPDLPPHLRSDLS